MKKNDILIGTCVDYTHEGLGVVKVDDFVFFMNDVLVGEEVEFVVTKLQKTYAYGKVTKMIKASEHREEAKCPYNNQCGGCQIMHMNKEEQLRFKTNIVKNNMEKIGGLNIDVKPTIGSDQLFQYRNKAQFPIQIKDGVAMGFYRIHSNDIIDMDRCMIQSDLINSIMASAKQLLAKFECGDVFRHLLIKHAFATNQVMVVFIARSRKIPELEFIVEKLTQEFSEIKSVMLNVNTRNDNVILGDREYLYFGEEKIYDEIDSLKFSISSRSFYQVNPSQTKVLYDTVLDYANIDSEDTVVDLYCGVGAISLHLAKKAKKVIGIEIVEEAIEDAMINAQINNIDNVEFIHSDAGTYAKRLVQLNRSVDVVVVDPPRKGCDELTVQSIADMNPKKVVYVSCNPGTLARDVKRFKELGYECTEVQPVDMFPNSYHVESVVVLHRTNNK